MSGNFQKNSAGIIASLFIGLIIISFLFTGYDNGKGPISQHYVAMVDQEPIKIEEFRRKYQETIDLYSQLMGEGKLPAQEKERIKGNVLQTLINQKLMLNFANDLSITPGRDEIAEYIKKLPYFQTNEKFDINLYKNLLANNAYTPIDFEKLVGQDVKGQQVSSFFEEFPVSHAYAEEVYKIKKNKILVEAVQLENETLQKFIFISQEKIKEFNNDVKNISKLESYFNSRKDELNQAEQVKARHILLKTKPADVATTNSGDNSDQVYQEILKLHKNITTTNFAKVAQEKSEDIGSKVKGGDLGWFSRGKMVPEFEEVAFNLSPGTISDVIKTPYGYHIIYVEAKKAAEEASLGKFREQMITEIMQREATKEVDDLRNKLAQEVVKALSEHNEKELDHLKNTYQLIHMKDLELTPLDESLGAISLGTQELQTLITHDYHKEPKKTAIFTEVSKSVVVSAHLPSNPVTQVATTEHKKDVDHKDQALIPSKAEEKTPEQEKQEIQKIMANKLKSEVLEHLKEHSKIVTNEIMLQ